jgi:DNA mismatch endonuclease (patch repair protein)
MRGNRKADTRPEVALRSALHASGVRFRKTLLLTAGGVRVRPDIVFTHARLAVFVDGCFWHACPMHGTKPGANAAYWSAKLSRNVQRDRLVDDALAGANWRVLRLWEHDVCSDLPSCVARICFGLANAHSPIRVLSEGQ